MITFIIFVLWKLGAPWWVFVLSIIGVLCEFDNSSLAHTKDLQVLERKINMLLQIIGRRLD